MKKLISIATAVVLGLGFASPVAIAQPYEETVQLMYEEEHLAKSTYERVVDQFGEIRPFINIIRAEENHVKAVKRLADAKGISLVDSRPEVKEFASLEEAYAKAIAIEKEDIKMLEELLQDETLDDQTKLVYGNLLKGSKNHLQAFEKSRTPETTNQVAPKHKGKSNSPTDAENPNCLCENQKECPMNNAKRRDNKTGNSGLLDGQGKRQQRRTPEQKEAVGREKREGFGKRGFGEKAQTGKKRNKHQAENCILLQGK